MAIWVGTSPNCSAPSGVKNRQYTVRIYNHSNNSWGVSQRYGTDSLAANLAVWEFCSYSNSLGHLYSTEVITDQQTLTAWQNLRSYVGQGICVTSGYRSVRHNNALSNSAKFSQHIPGKALDMRTPSSWTESGFRTTALNHGFTYSYTMTGAIHADTRIPGTTGFPTVREGDRGPYVYVAQDALNFRGFSLATDGIFGPITKSRVMEFQSSRGLTVDGIVGPQTWNALMP